MTEKKATAQVQTITYTRKVSIVQKVCPHCGKTFEGVKQRRFCSRPCQAQADYDRNAQTYRAKRMEKYHQRKPQEEKPARKGASQ
jgi:endogenous inhibitor of DNA gyrase (YacG/DUF329 family)